MAGPLLGLGRYALKGARKVYRNKRGQFTSKLKYELEQRRGPGGRFISKVAATRQRGVESYLRATLGAPPAGKNWAQIAGKYPERFADYLQDVN